MLDIRGLTKIYGKYKAADEVSFVVESGEIGILLGPNGAGKSTVIKSIAGLLRYRRKRGAQQGGKRDICLCTGASGNV